MSDTTKKVETASGGIAATVREKYGRAALQVASGEAASCCGPTCCGGSAAEVLGADVNPITSNLYGDDQTATLPEQAVLASLGCGNPTALATLREGEVVLDLGSGGGIDVLLSAKRVGPTGKAYGLDMTDEMVALARENAVRAGATNVEFLKGQIEAVPLPDASVDVIISNCVINLSTDKPRVLAEAFRVLRPGGRLGVSDVIADEGTDPVQLAAAEQRVGCLNGALTQAQYRDLLLAAGFTGITITPTYQAEPGLHSAIVQAARPAAQQP